MKMTVTQTIRAAAAMITMTTNTAKKYNIILVLQYIIKLIFR